ncbi:cytochrome P450 [Roseisalinus antarcticus]|uniref:Bifunctional P-450/NADPH-P450 reductase n=1 Tax=Roseisalinus antarcticus TaxID=254357 RepID=A0A1Y5S6S8_9RHOB|nr:cytochrome P450 [Roseisalinus antarcticus]SLN33755.1 Bifunctional P-450/NADPH-P450 reductase [Roseisalinus antarcticus]
MFPPPVPPKAELPRRPLSLPALIATARQDSTAIFPAALLRQSHLAGRSLWPWLALANPVDARAVLLDRARHYPPAKPVERMVRPLLGESFFLKRGEEGAWLRRRILPHFSTRASIGHGPHLRRLAAATPLPRTPFDAMGPLRTLTLRAILDICCGPDHGVDVPRFARAFDGYLSRIARLGPLDMVNLPPRLTETLGRRPGPLPDLRGQIDSVVHRRMKDGPRDDVLGTLIAARHPRNGRALGPEEVRDNILLMILAGHETSASTLGWAHWLLATHPEIQDRVRAEVAAAPSGPADVLSATPLLGAVIDETLRLYPPLSMLVRRPSGRDTLAGCPVGRHSFVLVSLYAMHRSECYWQDPDAFRPERFTPGVGAGNPAFLPFSIGPRSCPGATLAHYEARVILSAILSRVRLSPAGPPPVTGGALTLQPTGGVWLTATPLSQTA